MAKPCILGIDAGTSAIKVLAAEINADQTFDIKGSGIVPAVGVSKGNIVDVSAFVSSIRQAADCALMASGITHAQTFLGIGGNFQRSFCSIGSIAPDSPGLISREDVIKACRAAAITTAPGDYTVLDVMPIAYWVDGEKTLNDPKGMKGNRLEVEVHITAMPQGLITELRSLLQDIGIKLHSISSNAVSGSLCVLPSDRDSCLYVDVGAGLTDVVLFYQGQIRFSASLPLGGDYVTYDLMQGLSIGRTHAEEVKRYYNKIDRHSMRGKDISLDWDHYGIKDKKVSFDFLDDIIESRIQEIVSLTHHYLSPALHAYNPRIVRLTGGSSQMQSLVHAYEKVFNLPVTLLSPGEIREYKQPSNTVCYGLVQSAAAQMAVAPTPAQTQTGLFGRLKNLFKTENRG